MKDLKIILDQHLNKIYHHLYQRDFKKAEKSILAIIDYFLSLRLVNHEKKQLLSFVLILYHNFNSNYLQWVKKQKGDIQKEIGQLCSINHDNLLLAQCRDPASLDDLLYELEKYLNDETEKGHKKSVTYYLNCYRTIKPQH
jgi:hypothetical protein